MTLYEHLKMSETDYDTYDTKYCTGVTVCYIDDDDECDDYDMFCNNIIKKVEVVEINGDTLVVNWSELIERNMDMFKDFAYKYWHKHRQYEGDIDEFEYQWINEIHYYMAGYVSEDFYPILNEFVNDLK